MSIVHRDPKPEIVMVTSEGVAKVLAFGLARLLIPELEVAPTTPGRAQAATTTGGTALPGQSPVSTPTASGHGR